MSAWNLDRAGLAALRARITLLEEQVEILNRFAEDLTSALDPAPGEDTEGEGAVT